jgi:hypothetical protein
MSRPDPSGPSGKDLCLPSLFSAAVRLPLVRIAARQPSTFMFAYVHFQFVFNQAAFSLPCFQQADYEILIGHSRIHVSDFGLLVTELSFSEKIDRRVRLFFDKILQYPLHVDN